MKRNFLVAYIPVLLTFISAEFLIAQPFVGVTLAGNNLELVPASAERYELSSRIAIVRGLWSRDQSGILVTQPYMELAYD